MHDWLWYYLKRLPTDEALLRASEARLFEATRPMDRALLDWRETPPTTQTGEPDSSYTTVWLSLVGRGLTFDPAWLSEISRLLAPDGPLILSAPAESTPGGASPETWAGRLASAGFVVERWHYFFSAAAQAAYAAEDTRWAAVSHALTGHYVWRPWPGVLEPAAQRLRPFVEETLPEQGAFLFMATRKTAGSLDNVALPPAQKEPIIAGPDADIGARATEAESAPLADAPLSVASAARRAGWKLPLPLALIALSLGATWLAQSAWRANPAAPGAGMRWLAAALAMLWGVYWWSERRETGAPGLRISWPAIPPIRWLYLACVAAAGLAYAAADRPMPALLLWVIAGLSAFAALDAPPDEPVTETPSDSWRWLALAVTGAALIARAWWLTRWPFLLNGSEASLGLEAWRTLTGELHNPFSTAWLTQPTLPIFLMGAAVRVFGRTVLAVRFLSPIFGALTVYLTYMIGRRLWNPSAGLTAALLLAGSAAHIQYSRLGLLTALDTLLLLLVVGGIAVAWQARQRTPWLLAGTAIGLAAYGYISVRFMPLILVGWLGLALLTARPALQAQWRHILAAALLAFVIALPQLLAYRAQPEIFMERANTLSIVRNGWLAQEAERSGLPVATLLRQQAIEAALGYNVTYDRDASFNPDRPLLVGAASILALLGLGIALFHGRQARYIGWLLWLATTIIFGGALLLEPPQSRYLATALPAVFLLAGRALTWLAEKGLPGRRADWAWPVAIGVALLLAGWDAAFYFGRYQAEHRFGDRNTEIAYVLSNYLNELGDDWTAYFYGPPSMYVGFSTITYLATDFTAQANLFDVIDAADLPRAPTANVVHIFLPERAAEMPAVAAAHPGGLELSFSGNFADPLFLAYETQR